MSLPALSRPRLDALEARGHGVGALNIHPYFGRVDPALAHSLIESYSVPGDRILDPFCGSGTVLHEALVHGRSAVGWDSSTLAVAISLAKMSCPEKAEISAALTFADRLSQWSVDAGLFAESATEVIPVPSMPRIQSVESWFGAAALRELALIRSRLMAEEDRIPAVSRLLAWLSFSRIITRASNQQGESTYRRVEKRHGAGQVIAMYVRALEEVCAAASMLLPVLGPRRGTQLSTTAGRYTWSDGDLDVVVRDSRKPIMGTRRAELVVTSPPYLMSWDYGLYHKLRFYWLGIDLDSYEETEIGRHLRRRKDDVERYRDDMTRTFVTLGSVLTDTARVVLINSPSVVYGELVDTNIILAECGRKAGWELEDCRPSLALTGPHHGMYASLAPRNATAPGARGKKEHVLLFKRAVG